MKVLLTFIIILTISLVTIGQTIPTKFNRTITTCSTTVYDMGGSTSGLQQDADGSLTIYPETPGSVVAVYIEELDISDFYDYLYIYDGPSITSPLLQKFQGRISKLIYEDKDKREYYGTSGAITIRLKTSSFSDLTDNGFVIKVRCAPITQPNNMLKNKTRYVNSCNTTIYDQGGLYGDYENDSKDAIRILPNAPGKRVQITFEQLAMNSSDQLAYIYGLKTSATTSLYANSGYNVPDNPVPLSSGSTDGSVEFELISNSSKTSQGFRAKISCIDDAKVQALTETVVPAAGSATIGCGAKVWDNGHQYNYLPNTTGTITIQPLAGKKAQIDFSEFDLGTGDVITVYDGASSSSSILKTLKGIEMPSVISASETNLSGTLTLRFVSDATIEGKGFVFNTSCASPLGNKDEIESEKNAILLYPNPALDNIILQGTVEGSILTVFDSKGIIVFKKVVSNKIETISTTSWIQGLYHFTIEKENSIKSYPVSVLK